MTGMFKVLFARDCPEQLPTLFDFTDGRVTTFCERHQNHNKARKGTGFEFGFIRTDCQQ